MALEVAKEFPIKQPRGLSPRIKRLRGYYFMGTARRWNNEYTAWTTGEAHDVVFNEASYYIVPEMYPFLQPFASSYKQAARRVPTPPDFYKMSLPERRAWFIREVMVHHLPAEILPGDLLCGARFNIQASRCLDRSQAARREKLLLGKNGARKKMKAFHDYGFGNAGATCGHLIPDHARVLETGFRGIFEDLENRYRTLSVRDRRGQKGAQLRAMMIAAKMPRDLAARYAALCKNSADEHPDRRRAGELRQMAKNLSRVPWDPPETFWEAVQALWLSHMLVMADENYPGPGMSFGRVDQYLLPFWEESIRRGMDREFGKEILKCFWIHANTAYDALIRVGGNQGITSGFGQLITLSGMGEGGADMTNELTYVFLEVIDEMSPILEPKPNVRLHRNSPDELLDRVVDMVATSQGAPFLLNFDERSMAGMLNEARRAGVTHLIHEGNVHEYAPVGCLENTMVGNDRSGTVDINVNLVKALELALADGKDLVPYKNPVYGKELPMLQHGPKTGDPAKFATFEDLYHAYEAQTAYLIRRAMEVYEASEAVRVRYLPTPYLSCLVRGCAEKALDVTQGGAELAFVTIEGGTFATTVDSLLAVKYLVFDTGTCTMDQLIAALKDNWEGHDILAARAKYKAPKYGRNDAEADAMARRVMETWTNEVWKHKTRSSNRQARPGMLSWNYWVGDGYVLAATPDGRPRGQFLSNAICPVNGADINGPTANANSCGQALGGKAEDGKGDFLSYNNMLPNGASHTITFNPSILRDPEHKEKFKAYLRGYAQNGGTALQINMLDVEMLKDAQKHPADYRHLLVRVTGYNAYFTSIGRELQNEVIARLAHDM
ncbi:MAG: hypothetical protein JRI97_11770 [Deltaproteobacteria bacterium]|nr:hypothetical protein [Deltaproteobacteria bacterium]